jgi:uncharacterized protein (TIGR03089 family)
MQLASPPARRPTPPDLAAALASARDELGHRPAITVLGPSRRDEQGVASLAQWAAKGAHLLALDLLLEPGDQLVLDAPLGWTSAAVAAAAWWHGVTVVLGAEDPREGGVAGAVAVVEEGREPPSGAEDVLWLGAAVDGAPAGEVDGEAWVHAVQTFPDQPPAPKASPDLPALVVGDERWTQAELLALAAQLPDEGTLGLDDPPSLTRAAAFAAVTVRPLLIGRPTVVLREVDRAAAEGERVHVWR